jgi:hypothetical protein
MVDACDETGATRVPGVVTRRVNREHTDVNKKPITSLDCFLHWKMSTNGLVLLALALVRTTTALQWPLFTQLLATSFRVEIV